MTETNSPNRYRLKPEVVRLPARTTAVGGPPPVRIFLGTEDDQWRAERIFFYSIERTRDPDRTYEIYLMKNLAGYDRRHWRTGFTNYRFAIPEYAGFAGKAIYNDVDQIYLTDPAALFDTDLDGHGYLSVSAEDTSVMLIDCATMGKWWTLHNAIHGRKSTLIRDPLSETGTWGKLADGWNARDMEYLKGEPRLIHFTDLHLQPWQPSPDSYSYHNHPLGSIWFRLEREADESGYQVFNADRPSMQFKQAAGGTDRQPPAEDGSLRAFLNTTGARRVLSLGGGENDDKQARRAPAMDAIEVQSCPVDRANEAAAGFDAVVANGVLEACPAEDVPWLLDAMFSCCVAAVYVAVHCADPSGREDNVDVARTRRPRHWWRQQLEAAARRYPQAAWQLDTRERDGRSASLHAEGLGDRPRRVWILESMRAGDNVQLHCLAEALSKDPGWPYECKKLSFNKLHVLPNFLLGESLANLRPASRTDLSPPWPDIVIALGKRSASTARWIRKQSGGRTRLVHLGRPWARLDAFDLIVTTPQYRLPARYNVLHNDLPLTPVAADAVAARDTDAADQFHDLPRPYIAVLVGGSSWSHDLTPEAAIHLGREASRRARENGGSLLVTTSPRTGKRATEALLSALDAPHRLHRFNKARPDNPYMDYLAAADEILVTGESASMIADAVNTGKPVAVFDTPKRAHARLSTVVSRSTERLRGKSYRGTPRQQGPLARAYDALVERGLLTPARDLESLHRVLAQRGAIRTDDRSNVRQELYEDPLENTVRRVKALFSEGRLVGTDGTSNTPSTAVGDKEIESKHAATAHFK